MLSAKRVFSRSKTKKLGTPQHTAHGTRHHRNTNYNTTMAVCTTKLEKRIFSTMWYDIFQKAGTIIRVPYFFLPSSVCQGILRIVVCQGAQIGSTDIYKLLSFVFVFCLSPFLWGTTSFRIYIMPHVRGILSPS